jgi:hypothetical protein
MTKKPLISNDQALALINWMLDSAPLARKLSVGTRAALRELRQKGKPLTAVQLRRVQAEALALHLMDEPETAPKTSAVMG